LGFLVTIGKERGRDWHVLEAGGPGVVWQRIR
jgi:hypothetical protein